MAVGLPPLNACRAVEAAVRLGSFAAAAAELNMTPTAVSHHVKVLEAWAGRSLFVRRKNSVLPTAAMALFAPAITEALERIADAAHDVKADSSPRLLSISVLPDFAMRWLIPRLPRFAERHRNVELRLTTSYRLFDLTDENLDVAIRSLNPDSFQETHAQLRVEPLMCPDLVPIVSPKLLPRGRPPDEAWIRENTLILMLSGIDDWRRWLSSAGFNGINALKGPKFDSYALTTEAAAQGWGIALGRIGFIEAEISKGRLATPLPLKLPGQRTWFLLSAASNRKPLVTAFRRYILSEAKSF